MPQAPPRVGIIANPVSARDIRRIVAHAGNMQITDRANIVLRLLAGLKATGVEHVVIMPEEAGIRHHVKRGLTQSANRGETKFPTIEYLDMEVTATTRDSTHAAKMMADAGVAAIIVLGGDGTHRAVVSGCGQVPIAGVSTGTNNAFPKTTEPTLVGMAVGLAVTKDDLAPIAYQQNKVLEINLGDDTEIALVDVAIVAENYIGARALWRVDNFKELYVTFAETNVIGMSAIAALINPVDRLTPEGRQVIFDDAEEPGATVLAPIGPGMIEKIGIKSSNVLLPDQPIRLSLERGSIALDGEREMSFSARDAPTITLRSNAFRTINVDACLAAGGPSQLFQSKTPANNNSR